jgi:hypothetical protein
MKCEAARYVSKCDTCQKVIAIAEFSRMEVG